MFKSIISAKTRNVIIFGFHPSAQKCSVAAVTILRDAAIKAGAPEDCIFMDRRTIYNSYNSFNESPRC